MNIFRSRVRARTRMACGIPSLLLGLSSAAFAQPLEEFFLAQAPGPHDHTVMDSPNSPVLVVEVEEPSSALFADLPARQALREKGLAFELVYIGEFFGNATGGIASGGGLEWRDDWSFFLDLDTETAGWWEGGQFFLHLQTQSGTSMTEDYVGDFQVLSNIDADDFSQLSEFWYMHTWRDGRAKFKIGKMEANADFAFVDFGGEFINSSAGFMPTIPLTTYPDQDWGAVLGLELTDHFGFNAGIYLGEPDGGRAFGRAMRELEHPMYLVEPHLHYHLCDLSGTVRAGFWRNEAPGEEFDGTPFDDTDGWYLSLDQWLFKENPDDDEDMQGVGFFAQYGHSDKKQYEAYEYYGAGLLCTGMTPGRDEDVFGLWFGHVDLSDEPGAGFEKDGETTLEMFYKRQVTRWLSLKPDLQYVIDPGGTTSNGNALALGMRIEAVF